MGELAAILTAMSWGLSSIFFTSASRKTSATVVNRLRLLFALPLLAFAHLILTGRPFPLGVEPVRWLWLGASGVVGLILGDTFLFTCYTLIGNRLGTLIMAGVPVASSLMAWIFLGERLASRSILGILICVSGIALVVLEGRNGNSRGFEQSGRRFILGVLAGLGGAFGQAGGLILAKQGLEGNFPAISATLIRIFTATIVIWMIALFTGKFWQTLKKGFGSRKLTGIIFGGSVIGPFIGIWLSQIAIQYTYVGIASALMALTPIFLLPIARWYYHERVSRWAVLGTLIALAGTAMILL